MGAGPADAPTETSAVTTRSGRNAILMRALPGPGFALEAPDPEYQAMGFERLPRAGLERPQVIRRRRELLGVDGRLGRLPGADEADLQVLARREQAAEDLGRGARPVEIGALGAGD